MGSNTVNVTNMMEEESFFSLKSDVISEGDYVVIYISPEDASMIKTSSSAVIQNRLGRFKHSDIVGKAYGSQVWSVDGTKHMQLLRPTPELWTRILPHRTQILYMPDISFLIEQMEIKLGSKVIESGTGSGSFSHSIARAIGKLGHLYTFDFHPERSAKAQCEFAEHGLGDVITASCRDVCCDGFGMEDAVDSVFLDLPSPWLAIEHAKRALKKNQIGRLACFSPCMEQVQRTLIEMKAHGFHEIEMFECVLRPLEVYEISVKTSVTGKHDPRAGEKRSVCEADSKIMHCSKYRTDIKGHTSYLYFGSLLPQIN